ncbi:response regulator [Streptomyces sp. NPDC006512]|uniref:response regulator n=1 Tax=Streptomyces sp. NPDC006512 TaxID=3154307 RepID=UPI0033ACD43C
MTRVLVVDDEPQLVRSLVISLKARKYEVDSAEDGGQALRTAAARRPDVVLLDLGLPDMDGVDVIKRLRVWSRVPILVVSARHGSGEKVEALDAGADDYITKPFSMDELLARLAAAARRTTPQAGAGADEVVVTTSEFTVDLLAKRARRAGRDIRLTPTEWHLLEVLIRHRGRLVSQRQLLQEVWGASYGTQTNYLRVYMAHLRRKLEADPAHPRHLITAPGMGYRFDA